MTRTRWQAYLDGEFSNPANETLGFRLVATDDPDEIRYTWKVPEAFGNSAGNLQGGVLAAFADAVLGALCSTRIPDDVYPALAEMKISFFRPTRVGTTITGSGRLLKTGKRIMFAEVEVTGEDGELLAKVSGTELAAKAP